MDPDAALEVVKPTGRGFEPGYGDVATLSELERLLANILIGDRGANLDFRYEPVGKLILDLFELGRPNGKSSTGNHYDLSAQLT